MASKIDKLTPEDIEFILDALQDAREAYYEAQKFSDDEEYRSDLEADITRIDTILHKLAS